MDQLLALWAQSTGSLRWSSLRSSPCFIRCTPGVGLRTDLCLIFINDLQDNIKLSVRLFADDCILYRNIHSLQDCLILQEDLDSLALWEAHWQMQFNVAKCHSMRVTRHYSHKHILHDYTLHHQTLENVQSAKYLGITITENMDWGQHTPDISSKVKYFRFPSQELG